MNPPPANRSHRLHLFLSENEALKLAQLTQLDNVSVSDAVRQMIRREHAARFQDADGQLKLDVLTRLKIRSPMLATELMSELTVRYRNDPLLGNRIAKLLLELREEGRAEGSPAAGYTRCTG